MTDFSVSSRIILEADQRVQRFRKVRLFQVIQNFGKFEVGKIDILQFVKMADFTVNLIIILDFERVQFF